MSANVDFNCWKCGHRHEDMPTPVARNAVCESCNCDLHVCRQCKFFDTGLANACAEPVAEPVSNKERSNFCGYFTVDTEIIGSSAGAGSSLELNALFGLGDEADKGISPQSEDAAKSALDDLFGLGDKDPD